MALLAGSEGIEREEPKHEPGRLNAVYVGGLGGTLYDCSGLFAALSRVPRVEAHMVVRPQEWEQVKGFYEEPENAHILHRNAESLDDIYRNAEVAFLYYEPARYRHFTIPYKVFEYIENEKPIISSASTAAAEYIEKEGIGWVMRDQDELQVLLERLVFDKDEIQKKLYPYGR